MTRSGVTLFCDPTLAPAMRRLGRVSRRDIDVPVAVLCAPASLMLAQISRHTHNDLLFTLSAAMDQAVAMQLVRTATRVDGFANRLVLVALAGAKPLPHGLAGRTIALTDMTVASGLDGRAALAANGLGGASRILGAANTADVAFLVATGAADVGLVYRTDAQADRRLAVIAELAADPALTSYSAAVNAKAISPSAQGVLGLLTSAQGSGVLRAAGLGVPA